MHPGGAPQSHASSLLVIDHVALVAWFGGAREGANDTRIVVARGDLNGIFDAPVIVAPAPVPHWNPVLAEGPDGRVWLFFRRGPRIDTWTTWVCHSSDGGESWSDPVELVPGDTTGGRGPVRQAPVWFGDTWIAPGSVEVWSEPTIWDSFLDLSCDGRSWRRIPLPLDHDGIRGAGSIQPALVIGSRGQLVAFTRSTGGWTLRSETDDPERWPALQPCALPNNNSGLAAVTLPDGRLACVHNTSNEDWGSRGTLVVSVSSDDGVSWAPGVTLEDAGTGAGGRPSTAAASGVVTSGEGEFSYPCALVVGDELWVTYTWQRRGIALARVPLAHVGAE
ncbi:MAG: sialidase family protein [Propionibacteriaceae bacterium]|nr:sialidase family protein [Propionibacteriaceae bacterium]